MVHWGATARLAGTTNPGRDSIIVSITDLVTSFIELFIFLLIYGNSMDQTMLLIEPIIGRKRKLNAVPLNTF